MSLYLVSSSCCRVITLFTGDVSRVYMFAVISLFIDDVSCVYMPTILS